VRILITGYKGFIGQHMTEYLGKEHDLCLYEWKDGEVCLDNVDRVIHLGAITSTTCTDKEAIEKQNYKFSVDLITQCVQKNIPIQIASSASVYGPNNTTFKETDVLEPKNLYAKSKADIELFCKEIKTQTPVQLFRYFNVYGKHEGHKGNQASPQFKFKKELEEKGYIELFKGSENYYRDFVPVEYLIEVHKKFFNIADSGVWNVGTGKAKSFLDVAKEISNNIKYIEMPKALMHSYQKYTCANVTKLHDTIKNGGSLWQKKSCL